MSEEKKGSINQESAYHDLFMAILGGLAFLLLISIPWSIDEPAAHYPFYKGPTIFPIIILSVMFLTSLPSYFRLMKKNMKNWCLDGKGFPVLPAVILMLVVMIFMMGFICIGLEVACFLFFFTSMFFIGYRNWWKIFFYSMVYTLSIVILFKYLLAIYFPEPLIYYWWGG
jgi:hypothetical protein